MQPRIKWTFENIVRIAHMYSSRSMFALGHPRGYRAASKAGMLDYLFPKRKVSERVRLKPTSDQLRSIVPSVPLNNPKFDQRIIKELTDSDKRWIERDIDNILDMSSFNQPLEIGKARQTYANDGPDHVAYFDALLRKNNLI